MNGKNKFKKKPFEKKGAKFKWGVFFESPSYVIWMV